MIPIRVYVKGFLSYRDEAELHFDGAPLWVLAGKNGSGKSAIFDAITFALYGLHRGGKSNHEELINKASTELVVEFDFAVEGDVYRVKRTIAKGKKKSGFQAYHLNRATQRGPQPIPDTDKKEGFNRWVEQTLGLDDKTFTASVLLRQGESEALLTADPSDRHKMLAQIVDLSKYERLCQKADTKYKEHNANEKSFRSQLQDIEPVDEDEIKRLASRAARAKKEYEAAREKLEELSALKVHAERWGKLEHEGAELAQSLEEAKKKLRAVKGAIGGKAATSEKMLASLDRMIKQESEELDALVELQTALPWLKQFDEARAEWLLAKEEKESATTEAARIANLLSATIAEKKKAEQKEAQAAERAKQKRDELTKARTLLEQAKDRFDRFNEVDGSPTCSYCGQALSAEHLKSERARVAQDMKSSKSNARRCEAESKEADAQQKKTKQECEKLAEKEQSLREQESEAKQKQGEATKNQKREEGRVRKAINALPESFRGRIDRYGDIAACFASEFPTEAELSEFQEQVGEIQSCKEQLNDLRDLRPEIQKQKEREQRLAQIQNEIDTIPKRARRPLKELETEESTTRKQERQAEKERNDAEKQKRELESQRKRRAELEIKRQKAASQARLYKELARLLGRDNLQHHLLRQSEAAIVANANRVLDHISGGSLNLRLRDDATKEDSDRSGPAKALDLVAYNRRAGGGSMPVAFLSGSQRFRVAISLALGIGQYAGRASRRIESVIIDEGFGSLDSEGQREMIDELNSLKNVLTRIILVSHQEAFADAFPNRYVFELTDGTSQVSLKDEA